MRIGKRLSKKNRFAKIKPLLMMGFSIILITFLLADSTLSVFTVSINGKSMGQVRNKNQIYTLVDSVEKDLSEKFGTEATIDEQMISFASTKVKEMEPLDEDAVIWELSKSENSFLKSWVLSVDGKRVVAVNNEDKANQLLNAITKHYMKDGSHYLSTDFKESVEIHEENVHSNKLLDYEEALRVVLTGTSEIKEHQVRNGESFWTIAEKYQIPIKTLEAANKAIDPEKLQVGQKISLVIPKPYLTVLTTEEAIVSEKINFSTTYEKTDSLHEGEEKVKLKGVFGVKEISTQVVRENGEIVSTEVLDSAIVQEPSNQIVLLGTKAIPSSLGTGALDNPSRGTVTSAFGRRWGRLHAGIDIANKKGTPILAADGGVVTFAGWRGNYGLLVTISHGNGKTTLYGHCDEILVSQGDVVKKGQTIANMGDTGNSTGVHLHFEVRVNDVPQDPLKYVEYTVN